ncbi:malto-oligosyltrehalose synthase [Streptomyces sp. NBC_00193]|uniref:malto-oligosyltrehalose synthase n=1 Tax=unclassified Streptomyces TaxID=2593676 RepID=UPI002258DB56|nr:MULTISPECIES: malto-oligosyltrehalose synthase [unclassified Streptomyces]MCX5127464.1 malto-oligosyltrehalose synthase [Streptomyces sp. NBC_00347]MCX5295115.1 malto-oligosyltrehalose synthase [Streptomyces sp. NBC_00193]
MSLPPRTGRPSPESNRPESDGPPAVTPASTYRLQLRPEFTFGHARAVVPYLASLGVSHLHLSPVLEAVPGSSHGYDVTDHTRVRVELGGEDGLRALAAEARTHGLALVLDIVPNHMALPAPLRLNRPLWEVAREGPGSPYARWFDIDWEAGGGQLLLPVLGEPLDPASVKVGEAAGGAGGGDRAVLRIGELEFPLREGTAGLDPASLLAAQWYRPACWREARTGLNYRRFFTISELIGVRVEDPEVFAVTHAKVLELVRDGVAEGLRIDHVDGLADPEGYLRRLRDAVGGHCWVVVEKILAREERLAPGWPVAGTTGYDALYRVDGVLTDPAGAARLDARFREATGQPRWERTAAAGAREVLTGDLAAELAALERLAGPELAGAVRELLIAYPVYRPYPGDPDLAPEALERAAAQAGADPVAGVRELLLRDPAFAARFAQTSAALRAKSLEDRAFYRYAPLLSATEVGGDPGAPAVTVAEFHAYCAEQARLWPRSGTVLTTHDTKRSADVRARISVLSQDPDAVPAPAGADPQLAWVAWQTAFGLGAGGNNMVRLDRLWQALLKSVREAALHTTWTEQNRAYEATVRDYVLTTAPTPSGPLAAAARANLLGAALLHLAMPGVPEVYQGAETEYRALVDPDNRRPAVFPRETLARLDAGAAPSGTAEEKLALTAALLRLRRDRPGLFDGYAPLSARGPAAEHCVAFARSAGLVAVATRLSHRLAGAGGWRDTALPLPPGRWRRLALLGRAEGAREAPYEDEVPLTALLGGASPVAVLLREDADPA